MKNKQSANKTTENRTNSNKVNANNCNDCHENANLDMNNNDALTSSKDVSKCNDNQNDLN